jgi:dCMP deaminase
MTHRTQDWWDRYFLGIAESVAKASKDPSTQTGAVIVDTKHRIVSTGYNGFPPGVADDSRLRDRAKKYPRIVHGEVAAVVGAQRSLTGCTLYTWPLFGCTPCAAVMLAAGIRRAVAPEIPEHLKERWESDLSRSIAMWLETGARVTLLGGEKPADATEVARLVAWLPSGGFISLLDPDPALIKIEDIAHNLSRQCRYAGALGGRALCPSKLAMPTPKSIVGPSARRGRVSSE